MKALGTVFLAKSRQCKIEKTQGHPHLKNMSDIDVPTPIDARPPLSEAAIAEIAKIADRQRNANTVLMQAINFVGGQVEDSLKVLPSSIRSQLDEVAKRALRQSYETARKSRSGFGQRVGSDRFHKVAGTLSGAVGGIGGLPTALVELPFATTLIFRAVQKVAEGYGENPDAEETRLQCLSVFGAGGPGEADDGVDTAFISARLSISGAALNGLISKVAPKFATILSQKLASQAVPVLGAAAGAGTNYAFVDYYVSLAHVHFALRKLSRTYGEEKVSHEFHRVLARDTLTKGQT